MVLLGLSEQCRSGRAGVARVDYDFEARWFGEYEVKSAVSISVGDDGDVAGDGGDGVHAGVDREGLSGQDGAIWVRPAGTSSWFFSGYPNSSGSSRAGVAGASSYDFQARWFGVYEVKSAVAIRGDRR